MLGIPSKDSVRPNGDATMFAQRSEKYISLKIYNLPFTACTQRPTASLQRSHDVPSATLHRPWRSYGAQEVEQRAYGVLMVLIVLKDFYLFVYFEQHMFANRLTSLDVSKQFVLVLTVVRKVYSHARLAKC